MVTRRSFRLWTVSLAACFGIGLSSSVQAQGPELGRQPPAQKGFATASAGADPATLGPTVATPAGVSGTDAAPGGPAAHASGPVEYSGPAFIEGPQRSVILDRRGREEVFAPNMLGDFRGIFYIGDPPPPDLSSIKTSEERAAYRSILRFSAADNRSARPQTRVWYSYNYFEDAFRSDLDLHRSTFGAELMFLDQLMSVEILGHINSFDDEIAINDTEFGDLSAILKGVLYRDLGFLVSWGLGVHFPTGDRPPAVPGETVNLSPFVGYLIAPQGSRWFVQGFEELDILFREDRLLLQSDLGVGYWAVPYDPSRLLAGVAPTIEAHVYTPIPTGQSNRAAQGFLGGLTFNDVVNITIGATTFVRENISIATGIGFPVSSEDDYDYELQLHFNWRFGPLRMR